MNLTKLPILVIGLAALTLAGCTNMAPVSSEPREPEVLTIYPDGSMKLENRPIPIEDVVIYPDGYGGEKAAVKVRLEPFHSNFYRDTIIVNRIVADTETAENN